MVDDKSLRKIEKSRRVGRRAGGTLPFSLLSTLPSPAKCVHLSLRLPPIQGIRARRKVSLCVLCDTTLPCHRLNFTGAQNTGKRGFPSSLKRQIGIRTTAPVVIVGIASRHHTASVREPSMQIMQGHMDRVFIAHRLPSFPHTPPITRSSLAKIRGRAFEVTIGTSTVF